MEKTSKVVIFTDGSSRGNPGPGGFGAIISGDDYVQEIGGREEKTTNNRMELLAVITALEALPRDKNLEVNTDSAYVLSGSTRWVYGWKKNGWKTSSKEPVLNQDLWEKLLPFLEKKNIKWNLLPGHSGIVGNERCDVIATSFADNKPVDLYYGKKENYKIDLEVGIPKEKEKPKNKNKAYSYVSMINGNVLVHKTWEECKRRVSGVKNARFKKAMTASEEEEIIKEFHNL